MRRYDGYWLLFKILSGTIFGIAQVVASLQDGQLAFPSVYDNNIYLLEAFTNYASLRKGDVLPVLHDLLWTHPPHAPLTLVSALTGFLAFGAHDWAPCIVQFVFPIVFCFVVDYLGRENSLPVRAAMVLAALCAQPAGLLVLDNRPDAAWGLLIAGAIAMLLTPQVQKGSRAASFASGALVGFAILSKPSIMPVTGVMYATAFVLAVAMSFAGRGWRLTVQSVVLPSMLAAAVIALPYLLLAWRDVWAYIYDVALAPGSTRWLLAPSGSWWDEATFYLVGQGAFATIGPWIWIYAASTFLVSVSMLVRRDQEALHLNIAFLLSTFVAYLVITIPQLKSLFFGIGFAFMLVFGVVRAVFYLLPKDVLGGARVVQWIAAVAIVVGASSLFNFPTYYRSVWAGPDVTEAAKDWNDVTERILREVAQSGILRNDLVYLTGLYGYLSPTTLSYVAMRDGISSNYFMTLSRSTKLGDYLQWFDYAGAVVTVSEWALEYNNIIPQSILSGLQSRLDDRREFTPSQMIMFRGRELAQIYVRNPMFSGFDLVSGLDPVQRVANSHRLQGTELVHFGADKAAVLKVNFPSHGQLVLRVRAALEDRVSPTPRSPPRPLPLPLPPVPVLVSGHQEGLLTFNGQGPEGDAEIVLSGAPGPAEVTISYDATLSPINPRMAFHRIQFIDPNPSPAPRSE